MSFSLMFLKFKLGIKIKVNIYTGETMKTAMKKLVALHNVGLHCAVVTRSEFWLSG